MYQVAHLYAATRQVGTHFVRPRLDSHTLLRSFQRVRYRRDGYSRNGKEEARYYRVGAARMNERRERVNQAHFTSAIITRIFGSLLSIV